MRNPPFLAVQTPLLPARNGSVALNDYFPLGAGAPAEDRAGTAVVLALAISPDSRRGRRSSGNLLSLLPDSSGHAGSIPALFRPSATVAAAGGWDRWMERCCAGSNATSPTTDGLGEDEPRGWDYLSGASEQRGAVLLATSRLLTIKSDRHAVCSRKTVVWRIFHQ